MVCSLGISRLITSMVLLALTLAACASSATPAPTALLPAAAAETSMAALAFQPAGTARPFPTRTLAAPHTPQVTVTAQPFQNEELLWKFVVGEGETGSWCESTPPRSYGWIQGLILDAAKNYSNPNNATGQFSVQYRINGHADGFPDGVVMSYDNQQKAFCIQVSGHLPPGDYSIQYYLDVGVASPYGFPGIPETSKYLLMNVLPAVDFSEPNNNLLVFPSWGQSGGIALLNPDEPAFTRIANGDYLIGPFWSPDGSRIVYSVLEEASVYVINADGSGDVGTIQGYYDPDWSPDGRRIALVSENSFIWIANPDGSGMKILTAGKCPQWSPDASEIAYLLDGQLWLMNADGSDSVKLASDVMIPLRIPGQDADKDFAWSPDGSAIAFVDSTGILTVVNRDGASPLSLANVGQFKSSGNRSVKPMWSPDGSQIALDCDGLCIASLDGAIHKVVDSFDLNSLTWSHDGTIIYFSEWHGGILSYDIANGQTTPIIVNDFGQYNGLSLRPNP